MTAMRAPRRPFITFVVWYEATTRTNTEISGQMVVKAPTESLAIARVVNRIGSRYRIPAAAVEAPSCRMVSR